MPTIKSPTPPQLGETDPGLTTNETRTISSLDQRASHVSLSHDDGEALAPGATAGKYVIDGVLGAGGGGIVYSARHAILQRRAAVKVLRRHLTGSKVMMARFIREASAVQTIGHPNVVDVFEFDELADGRPFYVMELVEGTDLRHLLKLHGRFSPCEALDLVEPICEALAAVHGAGIVHRDLKASNVLVIEKEGRRSVKLLDFGVAKLLHPEPGEPGLTGPGMILGSVYTMSPEQILCEVVDARSDIYSLGVLVYQLLTGTFPYRGKPEEVAAMHLNAPRPKPSEHAAVSPAVDAVILRCMEREKSRRYPSVEAFSDDLRRAIHLGAASDAGVQKSFGTAIGFYVEVRSDAEEMDARIFDDMTGILDFCEQTLQVAGFTLPLKTSDAVLGVKLLSVSVGEQRVDCASALALARTLIDELTRRPQADSRVDVLVGLHLDRAIYHHSGGQLDVTGGPLVEVESWARRDGEHGLFLTDAFSAKQ